MKKWNYDEKGKEGSQERRAPTNAPTRRREETPDTTRKRKEDEAIG